MIGPFTFSKNHAEGNTLFFHLAVLVWSATFAVPKGDIRLVWSRLPHLMYLWKISALTGLAHLLYIRETSDVSGLTLNLFCQTCLVWSATFGVPKGDIRLVWSGLAPQTASNRWLVTTLLTSSCLICPSNYSVAFVFSLVFS